MDEVAAASIETHTHRDLTRVSSHLAPCSHLVLQKYKQSVLRRSRRRPRARRANLSIAQLVEVNENQCVHVLHIKPFFLLVDIHRTQCPRWLILERCKLCGHKTTTQAATL